MWSYLRNRLKPTRATPPPRAFDPGDRDMNPVVGASVEGEATQPGAVVCAAAYEGEAFQSEVEAFIRTFEAKPGMTLPDYLDADQWARMRAWFAWDCPEPEPKAFVRLAAKLRGAGRPIWEVPGLAMYHQGRWSQGGAPSVRSQEWVSVLAQVIGKPITVSYQKVKGGEFHVLRFEP